MALVVGQRSREFFLFPYGGRLVGREIDCRNTAVLVVVSCHLVSCWLDLQWSGMMMDATIPNQLMSCPSIEVLAHYRHTIVVVHVGSSWCDV